MEIDRLKDTHIVGIDQGNGNADSSLFRERRRLAVGPDFVALDSASEFRATELSAHVAHRSRLARNSSQG